MTVKKGFTLIEIIVSLIIVGVVAIIAIPNVINSMEQGKASAAKNNLLAIIAAQAKFNEDYASYCAIATNNCTGYCISTGTNPTGVGGACGGTTLEIDSNLHLGISTGDGFNYSCTSSASPYECGASDGSVTLNTTVNNGMVNGISCTPVGSLCPS